MLQLLNYFFALVLVYKLTVWFASTQAAKLAAEKAAVEEARQQLQLQQQAQALKQQAQQEELARRQQELLLLQQRDDSDRLAALALAEAHAAAEAEQRAARDRENAELRQKLLDMEKSLQQEAQARKVPSPYTMTRLLLTRHF